jgi:hypothetical protein
MGSLRDDIQDYEKRVTDNYQTLINVLNFAGQRLTTLLNEKDPPRKENPTFIAGLLDLALTIVLPHVATFVKAKKLSEAAKGLVEDVEMGIGFVKDVPKVKDAAVKLLETSKTEAEKPSATMGMMASITAMYTRLEKEKAAVTAFFEALKSALPETNGKPGTASRRANWKLPEVLGSHVEDLVYVFVYSLVRETVQQYGEIQIWVNKIWKDKDGWEFGTSQIVLERKLSPFSETSTNWIFGNLKRGLEGKALPGSANVSGGPATNRIEPVTTWVQLATAWQPPVKLEAVQIGMTGDGERYRNFKKGERLHSIFVHLHKTTSGYVPRVNKWGQVEGYDDPITAIYKKIAEQGKKQLTGQGTK